MASAYTFSQIRDFIKKDEPALIDFADRLLGLSFICTSAAAGPDAAAALLPLVGVKSELTKIGTALLGAVRKKKDVDFLAHQERLRVTYALMCYAAFFEALDRALPENVRKQLALSSQDRTSIVTSARSEQIGTTCPPKPRTVLGVELPHPLTTAAETQETLTQLYTHLAKGFLTYLEKLAVWDLLDNKARKIVDDTLKQLPVHAIEIFRAQYIELATDYPDFGIWASLTQQEHTRAALESTSDYLRKHMEIVKTAAERVDIGFSQLADLVASTPRLFESERATDTVDALHRHYDSLMAEPIIEDKFDYPTEEQQLVFPAVRSAFVPQSYKALRQPIKATKLESDATWAQLSTRHDLGAFFLRYLNSPYSLETPLVILGHPGSGKSLLTKVLAASLMSEAYTPIRVVLREVDADASIPNQIEQYINAVTSDKIESWARLAKQFKNHPPVIILDGYDELLQASGKVFSNYLKDVRTFMNSEAVQGRPVRVIVTSRITLIDKAAMPEGATIVRLLEFSAEQRNAWIDVWNSANAEYFQRSSPAVRPFALPSRNGSRSQSILALAEQPLLLLMLALYDSEGNRLRNSGDLDRTALYDNLLRRFVLRERKKRKPFLQMSHADRELELDKDMQRLGVTAIGMHNRRKLHILSSELEDDLKFFNLTRSIEVEHGRTLSQADLVLGSFFFVHRSKVQQKGDTPDRYDESSAFEFLHNTFSEYLAAEFILRQVISEVRTLSALQGDTSLQEVRTTRLSKWDGVPTAWFSCLIYTPLFSRPVVLEMMREWFVHVVKRNNLSGEHILSILDEIILHHIRRLLTDREMPTALSGGSDMHFPRLPLLGHMAIYSLNLITLRAALSPTEFFVDERLLGDGDDRTRPWDRLTFLWRSWFSLDNLSGLSAVFSAQRSYQKEEADVRLHRIRIMPKPLLKATADTDRLSALTSVGVTLGDNVLAGLAGLAVYTAAGEVRLSLDTIESRLESEAVDVRAQVTVKRVLSSLIGSEVLLSRDEAMELVSAVARRSVETGRVDELILCCALLRRYASYAFLESDIFHPHVLEQMAEYRPEVFLLLVRGLSMLEIDEPYPVVRFMRSERYMDILSSALDRYPEAGARVLLEWRRRGPYLHDARWQELAYRFVKRWSPATLVRRSPADTIQMLTLMLRLERGDRHQTRGESAQEQLRQLLTDELIQYVGRTHPELLIEMAIEIAGIRPDDGYQVLIGKLVASVADHRTFMTIAGVRPALLRQLLKVLARPELRATAGTLVKPLWHPMFVVDLTLAHPAIGGDYLRLFRSTQNPGPAIAEEFFKVWHDRARHSLRWLISEYPLTASEVLEMLLRNPNSDTLRAVAGEIPTGRDPYTRSFLERSPLALIDKVGVAARATGNVQLVREIEARLVRLIEFGGRPRSEKTRKA